MINKRIGKTVYIDYDDLTTAHDLIVFGNPGSGKTESFVRGNAYWKTDLSSIIVDEKYETKTFLNDNDSPNTYKARTFVFDVNNPASIKFNPFASINTFRRHDMRAISLAYDLLAISEGVPNSPNTRLVYSAVIGYLSFGFENVTIKDLSELLALSPESISYSMLLFLKQYKDLEETSELLLSALIAFADLDNDIKFEILDQMKRALTPLFTEPVFSMSNTTVDAVSIINTERRIYCPINNSIEDKYSANNLMFSLFLSACYKSWGYWNREDQTQRKSVRHFLLDNFDSIPVTDDLPSIIKLLRLKGLTSSFVFNDYRNCPKKLLDAVDFIALMGSDDPDPDMVKMICSRFNADIDKILPLATRENVILFSPSRITVDTKLSKPKDHSTIQSA